MAIWQHRLTLLPEAVLLKKFDVLPLTISMQSAEDFAWWSGAQPPIGFERQIDMMLPQMDSWSTSMRMWGQKDGNDAHVCYVDESKHTVEEISFRIDARAISPDLVRGICGLIRELRCVLMTSDYEILAPDESVVLTNINHSTARKFVEDPTSTLQGLDIKKIRDQAKHRAKYLD